MAREDVEADALHLPPGRTLGEFVIRERIGAGGFGIVFRAEQPLLAREAVLKVLATRHSEHDIGVQRFLREARLASQLDHPFAAHIYAFGIEQDGVLWIAMEYVRGVPLDQWLKRNGPFEPRAFAPFLDKLSDVIHTAHERKIVHRDIKPSNVMVLQRAGKLLPKLLDLGIAKIVEADPKLARSTRSLQRRPTPSVAFSEGETMVNPHRAPKEQGVQSLTQDGAVIGSPGYIAPELWDGSASADHRSDLYALGVLAFEAVSGQLPFRGESVAALADAHLQAPIPPCRIPELDEFFARSLAKKPADRFASALDMAAQFRAALGIGDSTAQLPRLTEAVRDSFVADAPEPLAELVIAVDTADSPLQARDATFELIGAIARFLGVLAMAAHSRSAGRDHISIDEALRDVRRHELPDSQWIAIVRALCRPYADEREAHAMPELVRWVIDESEAFDGLWEVRGSRGRGSDKQVRDWLHTTVPAISRLLASLEFLLEHALVVQRSGYVQRWNGQRRRGRVGELASTGDAIGEGHVVMMARDGRPLLRLWPLIQVASPTPGAPPEMFVLDGPGRHGARLRSASGFLLESPEVWDWLSTELLASTSDESISGEAARVPYLGLAAFRADHADRYVGREREVMECANRLRVSRILCVVGPSGAGKSSFVQAGVLPALAETWRRVVMRPGAMPAAELAARIADISDVEPSVVVIDQLEEVFTLCRDDGARRAFVDALVRLVANPRSRVILTLRDDFLMRAEALLGTDLQLAAAVYLLGVPDAPSLGRMLVEPARLAGYAFEDPTLVDEMVKEVAGRPGSLPLLSFAAAQLWERRDLHFRRLTREAYVAMGGVTGALARHADDVLDSIPREQQALVREAFRHLVTVEGTRAVLSRADLLELLGARGEPVLERLLDARLLTASDAGDEDRIEIIHEALVAGWPRLAEWRREDVEGARLRDQLRDAAKQWDGRGRTRGLLWRAEALAELRAWRARVQPSLTAVEAAFADASELDARRWRRRRRGLLVAAFVVLGAAILLLLQSNAQTREAQQESEKQEQAAKEAASSDHSRLVNGLVEQGRLALLDGRTEDALHSLLDAYHKGAELTPAVRFMFARALQPRKAKIVTLQHDKQVAEARYSPDGTLVLTASLDGVAKVWDAATGALRVTLGGCGMQLAHAVFSRDGRRIATACTDGIARLYGDDGVLRRTMVSTSESVQGPNAHVEISPDGSHVAVAMGGTIGLWDSATGNALWKFAAPPAFGLAFDPTGKLIATANYLGPSIIRDTRTGNIIRRLPTNGAVSIAFDHAGTAVVNTTIDRREAQIWDVRTGSLKHVLVGHSAPVGLAQFSPAGALVVTAARDHTARIWEATTGKLLFTFGTGRGFVSSLAFDPRGEMAAAATSDGSILIWDVRSGTRVTTLQVHRGAIPSIAFSQDGSQLLTASDDRTAAIWAAKRLDITAAMNAHVGQVDGAAFTTDGKRLITWGDDGAVRIWDPRTGLKLDEVDFGAPLAAGAVGIDGSIIVGDVNGETRIWDGRSKPRALTKHVGRIMKVAIDPTGTNVAIGGSPDPVVTVSEIKTRELKAQLGGQQGGVNAIAFRDRNVLVVGDSKGKISQWDLETGRVALVPGVDDELFDLLFTPTHQLVGVGRDAIGRIWSPSGTLLHTMSGHGALINHAYATSRHILTTSTDGSARIWSSVDGRWVATLRHPNLVMAGAFDTSESFVATGGDDGVIRLWDTSGRKLHEVEAHTGLIWELGFSRDGLLFSAGTDGKVVVYALPVPPSTMEIQDLK